MIHTDWKKELDLTLGQHYRWIDCKGFVHVTTKELDLRRNDRFSNPDQGENAGKDHRLLFRGSRHGE